MERVILSSELMKSPSMSKMQARMAGKLVVVFVSFGIYGDTLMSLLEGTYSVLGKAMSTE